MNSPMPPPEARLIAAKRAQLVPKVSGREAARRAGISPTRWRQLEAGVIRVRGHDFPEIAPAETLAYMALAVGVTQAELAGAGRDDAAEILGKLAADGGLVRAQAARMVATVPGLSPGRRKWLENEVAADLHKARDLGT